LSACLSLLGKAIHPYLAERLEFTP